MLSPKHMVYSSGFKFSTPAKKLAHFITPVGGPAESFSVGFHSKSKEREQSVVQDAPYHTGAILRLAFPVGEGDLGDNLGWVAKESSSSQGAESFQARQ